MDEEATRSRSASGSVFPRSIGSHGRGVSSRRLWTIEPPAPLLPVVLPLLPSRPSRNALVPCSDRTNGPLSRPVRKVWVGRGGLSSQPSVVAAKRRQIKTTNNKQQTTKKKYRARSEAPGLPSSLIEQAASVAGAAVHGARLEFPPRQLRPKRRRAHAHRVRPRSSAPHLQPGSPQRTEPPLARPAAGHWGPRLARQRRRRFGRPGRWPGRGWGQAASGTHCRKMMSSLIARRRHRTHRCHLLRRHRLWRDPFRSAAQVHGRLVSVCHFFQRHGK